MKSLRFAVVALLAASLFAGRTAAAAQLPAKQALVISAHNLTAESAKREANALAHPGDEIRYTLVFTNLTGKPVTNVQFVDPIPAGLVYELGSAAAADARQPMRIEYSIDGGKSYAERPMIAVVQNGQTVQQPAPAARYTHVRWTVLGSVAPGAEVTAAFNAQVNTTPGEAK